MATATAAAVLAVLALAAAPAQAAEQPVALTPAIPPELQALEAKADALQITSARISLSASLELGKQAKGLEGLARFFDVKLEGVETTSPPAGAFDLTLFGARVRLRYVDGHTYLFFWDLRRVDGGRPWIELGHGALGKLYGGAGKSKPETPSSGAARFAKLFTVVNDGIGLHELAPATLYGQAVTGFQEEVEPQAGQEAGETGRSIGAFSAARRPAPKPKPKATLSIYFAASGAPVRLQVHTGTATAGATVTVDYPAIDFPYTILAPPPSHVITEAALSKRFPQHAGKSKQ